MEIALPTSLHGAMQERANALGIPIEEAIRQAVSFYLSGVSATQNKRIGYTTSEVAQMVGLSTKTILRLVASGDIVPMPHSSRRYVFSAKEVERFADTSSSGRKKSPATRR